MRISIRFCFLSLFWLTVYNWWHIVLYFATYVQVREQKNVVNSLFINTRAMGLHAYTTLRTTTYDSWIWDNKKWFFKPLNYSFGFVKSSIVTHFWNRLVFLFREIFRFMRTRCSAFRIFMLCSHLLPIKSAVLSVAKTIAC